MDQGSINPNVVLTADTGQYDAAMSSSAQLTDSVTQSVDALTKKISTISKVAGASLTGIAILDAVAIGKATSAWADYEKQVSRLEAQAKIMGRNEAQAARSREGYLKSVKELRKEFGATAAEAGKLTLALSKMSDNTSGIRQTTKVFQQMSQATGESADGLAQSVLNLQKVMGTPQRDTAKYADQLTTLASSANTSASALADFSAQIAPMGRAAGMTQTEITGVSKAFITAGQDGYRAATAFNKIMSDITYATSTGSPDLAKYANLIGVTVSQFKNMSGAEKAVAIFDNLNRMGPRAIVELNRMGLDGVNMVKAITAMSQQTGGLGTAIQQAKAAYGDGSVEKGSQAAMKGISDEMSKLREELSMTAEEFGSAFGPTLIAATKALDTFVSGINAVMSSPLGDLIKLVAGAVAPIAGFAGGVLLLSGALVKLAGAALVWRNSGMLGLREGFRGHGPITPGAFDADGRPMAWVGGGGQRGAQIAAGGSRWQRTLYNAGNVPGRFVSGFGGERGAGAGDPMRSGFFFRAASPYSMTADGRADMSAGQRASRFFGAVPYMAAAGLRNFWNPQFDQLRYMDPSQRSQFLGRGGSPLLKDEKVAGASKKVADAEERLRKLRASGAAGTMAETVAVQNLNKAHDDLEKSSKEASTNQRNLAKDTKVASSEFKGARFGLREFGKEAARTIGIMGLAGAKGMGQMGMTGARGAMGMMGGPLGLALIGAPLAMMAYDKWLKPKDNSEFTDTSGVVNPYLESAGIAPASVYNQQFYKVARDPTKRTAAQASMADLVYAQSSAYKPVQTALKDMETTEQVMASLAPRWKEIKKSADAVNSVKLDLLHYGNFSREETEGILQGLNAGQNPGLSVFLDGMGTTGDGAKAKLAKAMGVRTDTATAMFNDPKMGPGSAGRYNVRSLAQIIASFGSSKEGDLTSQAINTFAEDLMGKAMPGVDLSDDDVRRLLQDKVYSSRSSVKGPIFAGYGQADFLADGLSSGLNTDKEVASFQSRLISRIVDIEGPGAGFNALGALGVKDASRVTITDPKAIEEALMNLFKDQRQEDKREQDTTITGIKELGGIAKNFAAAMGKGGVIEKFLNNIENDQVKFRAINQLTDQMGVFSNPLRAITQLGNIRTKIGSNEEVESQVAQALTDRAMGAMQLRTQFMQPQDAFRANIRTNMAVLAQDPSKTNAAQREDARQGVISTVVQRAQEIRAQLLQNKQFEISMQDQTVDFHRQVMYAEEDFSLQRQRAFADFHQQRMWAEQDYQRSRSRAMQDFHIQQNRAEYQFHLGMKRNRQDFSIARKRQEQDHHHQVKIMIEEQSKSLYNMYERVKVQQTNSATWLLVNSRDQTERMEQQTRDLNRLRRMGVNDDTLQQLGLTDANNAQQLSRFVAEVAHNPQLVRQFNREVSQRLRAARNLVTDESSTEWQEFQRSYRLNRERSMEDFRRTTRRAIQDFRRQMREMEEDFRRGLRRMAQDYETGQERMSQNFHKSMRRAATDYGTQMERMRVLFRQSMNRAQRDMDIMARGVQGTIREVMVKGARELRGELGKQARESLQTFDALGEKFGLQGWRIMKTLAKIFGFRAPNKPNVDGKGEEPNIFGGTGAPERPDINGPAGRFAAGGVVPGWSPGVDTHTYKHAKGGDIRLSGGEAIMRPEFTRAVGGEAAVHALNRAAVQGKPMRFGYWMGGVLPVKGASISSHGSNYSGYDNPFYAADLNGPGNDYGQAVRAWKAGTVATVRDIGDRSYGRYIIINHGKNKSLYAHLSDADVRAGERVSAGEIIGNVGDYGRTTGPHLHFEISGGSAGIGGNSGFGGIGGRRIKLSEILKDRYDGVEKAAARVLNGTIPEGHMSKMLNRWTREAWKRAVAKYGVPRTGGGMGLGHYSGGGDIDSNIRLAKRMAVDVGWGGDQWQALRKLWMAESGFRHTANNPSSSAYGIPQAIVGSYGRYQPLKKMGYFDKVIKGSLSNPSGMDFAGGDPEAQIRWGLKYIRDAYGSPKSAWSQWSTGSGYRDGSIFNGANNINVGEHGPEMVLPLNNHGAQFMADTLRKYSVGTAAQAHGLRNYMPMHNCGTGTAVTNINRSMNFHGGITVQANNPGEMISQLQARQRVMALTQPALGGARV